MNPSIGSLRRCAFSHAFLDRSVLTMVPLSLGDLNPVSECVFCDSVSLNWGMARMAADL